MIIHDRYKAILSCLQRTPQWTVDDLMVELGVSRSTLRRDLIDLEQQGVLVRVHGGILSTDSLRGEIAFDRRHQEHTEEKNAIAATAATLVKENALVYLDAGTTNLEVGRQLMNRPDIRIFTHSIRLLSHGVLARCPIVCVGGEYRAVSDAVVGGLTISWLDHLHCDVVFLGASGLSATGASTTELSECAIKQKLLKLASYRVLVSDGSKWEHPAAIEYAKWNEFDAWVTSPSTPKKALDTARQNKVKVILAEPEEEEKNDPS